MTSIRKTAVAIVSLAAMSAAGAAEYPIGKPQIQSGMEVSAVYLQPIKMEPDGMMRQAAESDVHLEADIRAVAGNPNGFAEGDWMPYLAVRFALSKAGSAKVIEGDMMPMVASDGPHYGDNVKLDGPGRYRLKLTISPPAGHFGRHVDKETGVAPWFKPFDLSYDFVFAGVGKKGGY